MSMKHLCGWRGMGLAPREEGTVCVLGAEVLIGYLSGVIDPGRSEKPRALVVQRGLQMQKATWPCGREPGGIFCSWVDLGLNSLSESVVVFV